MTDAAAARPADEKSFLGHPRGLVVLFFAEMWERFSFYGMRSILVLYLTQHFLFDQRFSSGLYGSYLAMTYAVPVLGGLLADRYLGSRKAVIYGGILLVLGHFGMAFEGDGSKDYLNYAPTGAQYEFVAEGRGEARVVSLNVDGEVRPVTFVSGGIEIEGLPESASLPAFIPSDQYEVETVQQRLYVEILFLSLAFIIAGIGFLKANISTVVGALYRENDPRRDSGYSLFYMGINLGSFIATLLVGYLAFNYGWGYGFGAAGVGMTLGLIVFVIGQPWLEGKAEPPDPQKLREKAFGPFNREWLIYLSGFLIILVSWQLVRFQEIVGIFLLVTAAASVIGIVAFSFSKLTPVERDRVLVALVLIAFAPIFWSLFEQAGSSMTLYAANNSELQMFGGLITMYASQVQFFNPLFIVILAPIFSWMWIALAKAGREPSTPVKFSLGLMQGGLGFLLLVWGATSFASPEAKVPMIFLVGAYFLHTTGELTLSPVGLSMVTKLSVARIVGLMMGVWFLANSLGYIVSGIMAQWTSVETIGGQVLDVHESLATYADVWMKIGLFAIGAGLFLLILSPILKKGMHGIR
ncbi:MAG: peptide MFS transporter [Parvularculaceae bacterium]